MRNFKMIRSNRRPLTQTFAATATALAVAGVLAGCGAGVGTVPTAIRGASIQGTITGGQQPVVGAVLQLYAAGAGGYGAPATPLLAPGSFTSHAGGAFDITGGYICPSASSLVYIVATGGDSGSGTSNPNLALMTALGTCGDLLVTPFISINELTTVGSIWALAPFMTGPANLATSANNNTGLVNAFADVNTLINPIDGSTPGAALPSGTTVPTAELNTLADIVASCVNTAGGTAITTTCGKLFAAANPGGTMGTQPTDTITAALNMAQHPSLNVATLYPLAGGTASPFQPEVVPQPNDFTVAVNYTGGNFSAPSAIASDSSGNAWITNSTGNTVTELSNSGTVLSGTGFTGSFNNPSALAFDASGSVWITNRGNNTVSRLDGTSGAPVSGSPYSGGGMNLPASVAIDSAGTAWVANLGNASVTTISSAGTATAHTPAGATAPLGIGANPH